MPSKKQSFLVATWPTDEGTIEQMTEDMAQAIASGKTAMSQPLYNDRVGTVAYVKATQITYADMPDVHVTLVHTDVDEEDARQLAASKFLGLS